MTRSARAVASPAPQSSASYIPAIAIAMAVAVTALPVLGSKQSFDQQST